MRRDARAHLKCLDACRARALSMQPAQHVQQPAGASGDAVLRRCAHHCTASNGQRVRLNWHHSDQRSSPAGSPRAPQNCRRERPLRSSRRGSQSQQCACSGDQAITWYQTLYQKVNSRYILEDVADNVYYHVSYKAVERPCSRSKERFLKDAVCTLTHS